MKRFFFSFVFLFGLWLLLAGIDIQEIILGAGVALLISLLFSRQLSLYGEFRFSLKALLYSIIYIFIFLAALIRSNLDVALRVIQPVIPINPGIVHVKTQLKSPLARLILANSITLTPGTLTVETSGEDFYIHWIDVQASDETGATEAIVKNFEKYLEVIFG
ncbi:MAG: Na+/H+ antiporter subunit E [Candidatus Cloacimonetes bacterium]|nr:Na+/H+ antiporter subunit E [Candidatus Cloacimonadota bacterium]